jgi:serine/threonine-protein kinase HipA
MRPDQVRGVEVADVYKGDVKAGTLRRGSDGVTFRYERDYLDSSLPAVASTLPRLADPVTTPAGAIPPFFAGLLPEGARLDAVIAAVKTSPDDELSLLLAVGGNAIGDVAVVPEGATLPDASAAQPVDPSSVSFRELFARSVDPNADSLDAAIPGVQDKLSDMVVSFPVDGLAGPSILKLTPPRYPLLVENEAFFLKMARTCGFRVPQFRLLADRDGLRGLLVERFDRDTSESSTVVKLAQEDACQLAARWPADKYRLSMSDVVQTVSGVVSSPLAATLEIVLQTAFAALICNGDLHAKNLSVRWVPAVSLVEVTPVYDVVSTRPYPVNDRMALRIDGRDNRIRGSDLVRFAARFGLSDKLTTRRLVELTDRAEPVIPTVGEIGFDDQTTTLLESELRARLALLRRF